MKATVLVPTYRRPGDLERCLAALRRQIEPAEEVLAVVREGDEETFRCLWRLEKEEMGLRWVTAAEPGQIAALNRGLAEVSTEIVAILDDDAAPHPEWLARIRRHFEADATTFSMVESPGKGEGRWSARCNGSVVSSATIITVSVVHGTSIPSRAPT